MGSCIICGTSTDGRICSSHEEDVVFEFKGTTPNQLTKGRFYRGTVDGYAEFGVFVNIGDHVTGLLHRSEIDRRLESLTWEQGDDVYVQVKGVRDNGNIDLGWSIRQADREFRGALVDDPSSDEGTYLADEDDEDDDPEPTVTTSSPEPSNASHDDDGTDDAQSDDASNASAAADADADTDADRREGTAAETATDGSAVVTKERDAETSAESEPEPDATADVERVSIDVLSDLVGDVVRLEGRIVDVRQTSGPTVFELRDESGLVDCAAFVEAGVRAYPDVEQRDLVRLDGEVRERRGELQIETEALVVLDDDEAATVTGRMDDALDERARPADVDPLAADDAVDAVLDETREAATAIRRAIIESRPIVVRHDATVDGYLAGAAIERAVLPLLREEHASSDAVYHYFDRRPLETVYDLDDATKDVSSMLSNRDRHDEKIPLMVFAGVGATRDSLDGFGLLDVYGADRVVVDAGTVDEGVSEAADVVVAPAGESETATSATALATAVAVHVDDAVREDLRHLPAASFWEEAPSEYVDLAADAGYKTGDVEHLQEAIALEAYYQSYEDKRELVEDLLFEDSEALVDSVSEQFREKLATEVETAEANLDERAEGGVAFAVLDTDAFTHRFDFPSTDILLDEVHRRNRDGAFVTLGVAKDELRVRSTFDLDTRAVADAAREHVENAGIEARGGRDRIEFVAGERDTVVDAVVDAIADLA
ncbi:DHH family phosphoesterase [Halomarina oriensis]|uniref:S1 RNA-binding domain-containing protein n=1 Tax=Halomarina oriensis TaxID=671145 RepID=A0A6B0GYD4_9EURY|nr:OB-fold nucleic acid binding domain-containing protein [Halomarina oriensis]MWG36758.1 S1 RNA-binding domain-containing protein [Halomarina oriensis]